VPEEKRAVVVRGISECWADVFPRFVNRLLEPPRSPWSYPILGLVPVVFFQAAVGAIMVSLVYTCYRKFMNCILLLLEAIEFNEFSNG
jgi:hypothetical protein